MSAYQDLIKRWLGTFLRTLQNARRTPAIVGRCHQDLCHRGGGRQRRGGWITEHLEPRPLNRAESSRPSPRRPSPLQSDVIPCQDRGAPPPKRLNMLMSFALASSLDNYTRLHQEETLTHRRGSRHPSINRHQQETLQRGSDKQWGLMCMSATCTLVRKSRIIIFL